MKVITGVEIRHSEYSTMELHSYNNEIKRSMISDFESIIEVEKETIHGRVFTNQRGERICIGMDKATQETIGLMFEVFESLQETVESKSRENSQLYRQNREDKKTLNRLIDKSKQDLTNYVDKVKNASLLTRVKYLLTGKIGE